MRGIAPATLHVLAAKDRPLLALPASPSQRLADVADRLHALGRHSDAVLNERQAALAEAGGDKQDWFYARWAGVAERALRQIERVIADGEIAAVITARTSKGSTAQ